MWMGLAATARPRLVLLSCATALLFALHSVVRYNQLLPGKTNRKPNLCFRATNYRLGNALFAYAAMFGLSRMQARRPCIDVSQGPFDLYKWFNVSAAQVNVDAEPEAYGVFEDYEHACQVFAPALQLPDQNLLIKGQFQSYLYFQRSMDRLRNDEFRFKDDVLDECRRRLRTATGGQNNCTRVGVHVRRGDFTKPNNRRIGFVPASAEYLQRAIDYYRAKFAPSCVQFIVLGDEPPWNRQHIQHDKHIVVLERGSAAVDLCVLAQCQHSIITTGTFGWWAAWLADGHVTYQNESWAANSRFDRWCQRQQYFLPHWVPL